MTDWQEAYFDAVNKVETETIQQGDLVPIWNAFKAMSQEIQRLRSELEQLEVDAMEHYNDFHEAGCDQKSAIDLAFAVAAYCRAALMGVKP
jgi:flagellar hook-associated protein FlgK